MILVIGGTGATGRPTVESLVARGEAVRVVTRDPARVTADLHGAELVAGDSTQPHTLSAAFADVDRLYYVPPTVPGWNSLQQQVIQMARAAGVGHMVRISALGTHPDAASMSLRFHWEGEREMERSGMAFTHIRGNSFFQNTLFDAPTIRSENAFYSCVGELRFAKVDTRDIGEVVATVLTEPGHDGKAYTLTGPAAMSYADMAAIMSAVLSRPIRYVDLDVDSWARRLINEGFPAWLAEEFAAIYGLGFDDPSIVDTTTDTIETVLGRSPRTFEQFVAEHRADFE